MEANQYKVKQIGSVKRSKTENVVVSLTLYKNELNLDIRQFFATVDEKGTPAMQATKKGISLPAQEIGNLIQLLTKAQELVKEKVPEKVEKVEKPVVEVKENVIEKVVAEFDVRPDLM